MRSGLLACGNAATFTLSWVGIYAAARFGNAFHHETTVRKGSTNDTLIVRDDFPIANTVELVVVSCSYGEEVEGLRISLCLDPPVVWCLPVFCEAVDFAMCRFMSYERCLSALSDWNYPCHRVSRTCTFVALQMLVKLFPVVICSFASSMAVDCRLFLYVEVACRSDVFVIISYVGCVLLFDNATSSCCQIVVVMFGWWSEVNIGDGNFIRLHTTHHPHPKNRTNKSQTRKSNNLNRTTQQCNSQGQILTLPASGTNTQVKEAFYDSQKLRRKRYQISLQATSYMSYTNSILAGSSKYFLINTRNVTASLPSSIRWS